MYYWKKDLPLELSIPRKKAKSKKVDLNLNQYRNLHWGSESENKKYFSNLFGLMDWFDFKLKAPYKFYYFIHITKEIADLMNVGAILDKYLCDMLVEADVIKDDNVTVLNRCEFIYDTSITKTTFDLCITNDIPELANLKKQLNYEN